MHVTHFFVYIPAGIGVLGRTRSFPDSVSDETVHILQLFFNIFDSVFVCD